MGDEKDDKGTVSMKFVKSLLDVLAGVLPLSKDGKKHFKKVVEHLVKLLDAELDMVDKAVDTDG